MALPTLPVFYRYKNTLCMRNPSGEQLALFDLAPNPSADQLGNADWLARMATASWIGGGFTAAERQFLITGKKEGA